MSTKSTPVYVWIADKPIEAGVFTWRPDVKVGAFEYRPSYLEREDSFSLDPVRLPLKKGQSKETTQNGIFGVLRDSGPDTWGRNMLTSAHGPLDDFEYLTRGVGDGAGAICVGEPRSLKSHTLSEIDAACKDFPPDDQLAKAVHATTSMGGAKPKLLAFDDGAYWIAKFPERGDPPRLLAINEHVMLSMANDVGIDACTTRTHTLPDGRLILLAKRFDMTCTANGTVTDRHHYASAHTVLRLDTVPGGHDQRNYLEFASRAVRWSPDFDRFELWKRIVYNAMVANRDDHPRNHALIRVDGAWRLSPAFDIVAAPVGAGEPLALVMAFHSGGSVASPEAIYESAVLLDLDFDEAIGWAKQTAARVDEEWHERMLQAGATPAELQRLGTRLGLSSELKTYTPAPPQKKRQRFRRAY